MLPFLHLSFDGMEGCAFFMLFVGGAFWVLYFKRKRAVPEKKWLLWYAAIAGPCAFLALELGWMVTEEGRQPWVIYGLLLTKNAVNPAQWMNVSFAVFSCIYIVLASTLAILLLKLARSPKPPQSWSEALEETNTSKQPREAEIR
jgi:cytochrome d ubiquinol oxidase subunit I